MDLWTQASRDIQAEAHLRTMTAIRVEGSSIWPFLALARSEGEFAHRLALVADRVDRAVATVIPPEDPQFLPAKDQYLASLAHDFAIHLEAQRKQAVETAQCARCGKTITHGGSKALAGADQWFDSDDNFMCPDGEEEHRPGSSKESASNKLPPEFLENVRQRTRDLHNKQVEKDEDEERKRQSKESSFRTQADLTTSTHTVYDQSVVEAIKAAASSVGAKVSVTSKEGGSGSTAYTVTVSYPQGNQPDALAARKKVNDAASGGSKQSSFNEEAFKAGMRLAEVAASSARAINTGLVVEAGEGQTPPQDFIDGMDAYFRRNAFRKGAPFAGYTDFDSCVKANSDKDSPEAYCGKIKHDTEDKKEGSLQTEAGAQDDEVDNWHRDLFLNQNGRMPKADYDRAAARWSGTFGRDRITKSRKRLQASGDWRETATHHEWPIQMQIHRREKEGSLQTEALKYKHLPASGNGQGIHMSCTNPTCAERGNEYSPDRGDYFMANDEDDVKCGSCGGGMSLFKKHTVHEPYEPKNGSHQGAYNPFSDPESAYNNPDKGPHKGTPDDLFPDGVPLHGDLSPEQEAWLKRRGSRLDPKEGKDAPQRALPRRPGEVKTHMMRDHGFAENAEFHEVKHERLHMANPWGVSGHGAKPHWHSEYDPTKRGSLDPRSAAAPFPLHRRESDEPERKPDVLWYESEPEKEVEPWPSARQGSFVRLSEIPSHSSVTCTYCNRPIGGTDRVVETPHGPRHAEHAHMGSLQTEAVQARDLRPGHVINHQGQDRTVKKVEYSPGGGGRAYVEFEDGVTHKFPAAYQVTPHQGSLQAAAAEEHWLDKARAMLDKNSGRGWYDTKIDNVTSNMLVTVHDALSPENQEKFRALPLHRAVDVGWKMTRPKGASLHTEAGQEPFDPVVAQCIGSGQHLTSVDDDGFCNFCGRQEGWDYDAGDWEPQYKQSSLHTAVGPHRPIHEIAREISREWGKQKGGVNFAAKPYLEAMHSLKDTHDNYGADSGHGIVSYFLGNASQYRGEAAKAHKAELKAHLKERPRLGEPTTASLQTFAIFDAEGSLIDTDEDQGRANALAHLVRGSVRPFSEATEDQPGTAGLQSRTADMFPHLHADCEFGDGPIEFQLPGGWIHSDTFAPQCSGSVSGEGYNTVATPKPDTVRQASLSAEAEAFTRYELQEQRYDAEDSYELGYADGVQGKPSNSHMFRDWGTTNYPVDLSATYEHGYLDGMMARSPGEIHDPGPGQSVHESPGRQPVHVPRMAPAPGIERERARERELVYATKHTANPYDPENNPYLQNGRDKGSSMPDMAGNTPVTTRPRQIPRGPSTTPPPEPGGMDLDPGDTDLTSEREDM